MASNYNSLGFQLMTTGEKAGTWGTLTNTTWNEVRDLFGYITVAMTADRTLTIPDASTGTYDGRAMIIECNGALGANRVLDIAATAGSGSSPGGTAAIYKPFIIYNNTSTAYTLTFKVTGATGFVLTQGSTYLCYHNGTDIVNTGLLSNVEADTSPSLGGNLDVNSNSIVSASNGNIPLAPNGTGEVLIGSGSAAGDLTSSGAYDLIIDTNTGTNAGNITLSNGANGDITFTNNGTGNVKFNDAAYNPEATLTDAATVTWDAQAEPIAQVTLTDNRNMGAPSNGVAGQFISLLVIQDAGGTNTLTWNAVYEFPSETAPTLTSTGDLADLFVFRYHNSKWLQVGATLALTVA